MDIQKSRVFTVIRALCIENNLDDIKYLQNEIVPKIEDLAIEVVVVKSISEAKEKVLTPGPGKFDVILLGLNLPNGEGIAAVTRVLEFSKYIPILVLSSIDDETTARRAVKLGVQDYLIKGEFNQRGFRRAVTHALYRIEYKTAKDSKREQIKSEIIQRLKSVSGV